MLACFECRNLVTFVQTSGKGDARTVTQTIQGTRVTPWDIVDERPSGLWCEGCGKTIEADLHALGLADDRIAFVSPQSFDAEALAAELMDIRRDADWSRRDLPAQPPRSGDSPDALQPDGVAACPRPRRA